MHHIVTITFSPSIDKSTTVSSLLPEKKLKCTTPRLDPGGGGINVARAIKKLGGEATAIFPSGGYTGKFFNHLMHEENIPSIIIETSQETRENIEVLDESSGNQYRFGFPGTELSQKEWKECVAALENIQDAEFIVASGSLPPGVPVDVYGQLAKIAKKQNSKFIVDTSGEALRHALEEGVYMIKPNLGELSALLGISRIETDQVESFAKKIIDKYHCEIVVVSYGKDGAMLVTKSETYQVKSPEVTKKSTVGAGDSMVAGIVLSISKGMNLKQALQYGVACGTAATMNPGTELCNKKDADHLFRIITGSD
jgi:6-phosphofructokinase 2